MFQAVRESLAAALPRRGKRLAALFAFEFVVVLLGVLAAQVVQNWAREREVRRETLEARQRLERGYGDAIQFAAVWTAAMPCLRERVGEIMPMPRRAHHCQMDLPAAPSCPGWWITAKHRKLMRISPN